MSADRLGRRTLIVTPYFNEPRALIERCIDSVARQTVHADHLLIADGHPAMWIDALSVRHIKLDRCHANFGNTPRAIGLLMGVAEGYSGIGLLDADNWIDDDHVAACWDAAARGLGCDYVAARRRLMHPDGREMAIIDEPVETHIDTSCFFLLEGSFATLPVWGTIPRPLSPICDRIFYAACKAQGLKQAITDHVTVNYHVTVRFFFDLIGESAPPDAKAGADFNAIQNWIDSLDDKAIEAASRQCGSHLQRRPSFHDGKGALR